ncbi:MAG: 4Fe-4S binding protein [Chitinispirillaceae bacterium]|nr:4Fe-4S binding protein [Chitinispirillaceae bacterium]
MSVQIETSKCDKCGTCISVCPCDALVLTENLKIIEEKCSECGNCVKVCPIGALDI